MPSEQLNLEVVEIIRNWNDLGKRGRYERRLHELGPTAVETLLVVVRREVEIRKRLKRIGGTLIALTFGFIPLKMLLFGSHPGFVIEILYQMLLYASFMAGIGCLFWNVDRATNIIVDFDDVRAVGPLVEAWQDFVTRPAVTDALIRLLPKMKSAHTSLLTADQRKSLYKILRSKEETLVLVILKALEQIGDSSALPYVERLAEPLLDETVSAKVQKAAQECLPFLQDRAQQERDSTTLLRAAEGTTGNAGELLRPVSADTETDSRDLLRATQQE